MSNRLEEMLREGKPPGLGGSLYHLAPDCADLAIPRALRELETGTTKRTSAGRKHTRGLNAKEIARGAGYSVAQLRSTWKI